ncbi:MAG: hypothetical protein ABIJ00_12650 [Candidatus Eisenbacteria bacterium]
MIAVINGHVHANRVAVHNDIYYIDIGATLVGRPSIRYFRVFPDRIEVTYEYISNRKLLDHTASLCLACKQCFNPLHTSAFMDGDKSDKEFTIQIKAIAPEPAGATLTAPVNNQD